MTKQKFSKEVEQNISKKSQSTIDSIIEVCDKYEIEIQDCKKFLTDTLVSKLEAEARSLNFLPKINTLCFD